MKIGITCYPTYGGSSTIACELGLELNRRGHEVHFICYNLPLKIIKAIGSINFHKVDVVSYPLFKFPPYTMALASKMYECINTYNLDLLHVHYAIPHSTSAFLAKKMLDKCKTKIVTTLHGTDIRLLGLDPSYREITRFSIEQNDGVTAVSKYLEHISVQQLNITKPIEVIYNFVDTNIFKPDTKIEKNKKEKIITHISNFRQVKNIPHIIQTFFLVRNKIPARLQLIGNGPEKKKAENLVKNLNLQNSVDFIGQQDNIEKYLQKSDLLLLLSETESFGLVAIEAMSCGVPVIATNVGGLPEIIKCGKNGFLVEKGDISEASKLALQILKNNKLLSEMRIFSRKFVKSNFSTSKIVSKYENYYDKILSC